LISSHDARRTFATLSYLKNIPIVTIMKITGHRTPKAFLRYVQISRLDHAKLFSKYLEIDRSQMALRVAM